MIQIDEDEFKEWHAHVLQQRERYRIALERIRLGSKPQIPGMASGYVKMKREELMDIADKVLYEFR